MATLPPPPLTSPLAQKDGTPSSTWARWLSQLQSLLAGEAWAYLSASDFQNGWESFSAALSVRYKRGPDGRIWLGGAGKSGTVGSTAFTLPAGYRPDRNINLAVDSDSAFGKLLIQSNGTVTPAVGSNVYFSFECTFPPA